MVLILFPSYLILFSYKGKQFSDSFQIGSYYVTSPYPPSFPFPAPFMTFGRDLAYIGNQYHLEMKLLDSNEIRQLRDVCIFEVNGIEVYR